LSLSSGISGAGGIGAAALVANQGSLDLGAGINETVNMLLLNGAAQGPGTYGSTASSALFKNDAFFSGSGIVTVLIPEPTSVVLLLVGIIVGVARRRPSGKLRVFARRAGSGCFQ